MVQSSEFTVSIRVPTGRPEGLRIITKANSTLVGFAFPFGDFRNEEIRQQEAMTNPGFYIIWGDNDDGEQRVYIGIGDSVIERLRTHASTNDHPFWNETIVCTSNNRSVTSTHARFVESELIRMAKQANPEKVVNDQDTRQPNMSDNDMVVARGFLSDALSCMEIVGVPFFRATSTSPGSSVVQPSEEPEDVAPSMPSSAHLYLRSGEGRRETNATGYRNGKELVVLAGARAAKDEAPSASDLIRRNRSALIEDGYFVDRGDHYELVREFVFGSPSAAAQALLGVSSNGWDAWKNTAGISLKNL